MVVAKKIATFCDTVAQMSFLAISGSVAKWTNPNPFGMYLLRGEGDGQNHLKENIK